MPFINKLKEDQAMGTESFIGDRSSPIDQLSTNNDQRTKGGIDLNPADLEIETKGGGFDFEIPYGVIDLENFTGFTPVIIQMVPVVNAPLLLGLEREKEKGKSKKKQVAVSWIGGKDQRGLRAVDELGVEASHI